MVCTGNVTMCLLYVWHEMAELDAQDPGENWQLGVEKEVVSK